MREIRTSGLTRGKSHHAPQKLRFGGYIAGGRRTPILFTSSAAKRNPSLIAHGELLGDVALRLMLQRIAYPEHPPCELYLDIPAVSLNSPKPSKKGTKK